MKLIHSSAVCRTEENANRFFKDILGLAEIKRQTVSAELTEKLFGAPVACPVILYGAGELAVEVFITESGSGRGHPAHHVAVAVPDREGVMARCEAAGLKVNRATRGDALLVFVEDLDGNLFEIKEAE